MLITMKMSHYIVPSKAIEATNACSLFRPNVLLTLSVSLWSHISMSLFKMFSLVKCVLVPSCRITTYDTIIEVT